MYNEYFFPTFISKNYMYIIIVLEQINVTQN